MSLKTVLISGSNKGIGLEIVRQLAEKGLRVILTARDEKKGEEAIEALKKEGHEVIFHKLDVTDPESIKVLASYVQNEIKSLDVLINNAGILLDAHLHASDMELSIFHKTMNTNFYGPLLLIQAFIPLLKKSNDARIINVSSGMGAFNEMSGGYPAYRISKTALNALSVILASELQNTSVKINSMCPGWVATDMGGKGAPRKVSKGAETAVWLAIAENIPTGKFFRDKKEISW